MIKPDKKRDYLRFYSWLCKLKPDASEILSQADLCSCSNCPVQWTSVFPCFPITMRSSGGRTSSFARREEHNEPIFSRGSSTFSHEASGDRSIRKNESQPNGSRFCQTQDNRLKCKFEAIDVLLRILLHQDELTLKEYTINDRKIKVLVIEDTEF